MNEDGLHPNYNQFQREVGAPAQHQTGDGSQPGFINQENSMPESSPMMDLQQGSAPGPPPPPLTHVPTSDQNHVKDQPRADHLPRVDHVKAEPVARIDQEIKSEPSSPLPTDPAMQAILAYLRKHNLTDTETKLKDELKKREVVAPIVAQASDPEVGNVLAAYRSDGDPSSYESAYR